MKLNATQKELLRREVLAKQIKELQLRLARMQAERDALSRESRGLKAKLAVAEQDKAGLQLELRKKQRFVDWCPSWLKLWYSLRA